MPIQKSWRPTALTGSLSPFLLFTVPEISLWFASRGMYSHRLVDSWPEPPLNCLRSAICVNFNSLPQTGGLRKRDTVVEIVAIIWRVFGNEKKKNYTPVPPAHTNSLCLISRGAFSWIKCSQGIQKVAFVSYWRIFNLASLKWNAVKCGVQIALPLLDVRYSEQSSHQL